MVIPARALRWSFVRSCAHSAFQFVTTVFFILCLVLPGQTRLVAQDDDDVVRVNTDLIVFPVRIREKRNQTSVPFTQNDISLKDPDGITSGVYFSAGVDRVALVFALDESGSLREIMSQQQAAAMSLFSRFGNRSTVAVLRFSDSPQLVAPFSTDLALATTAFKFPAARDRHTAIFDAAAKAITTFETLPRVRGERRIVILISDGLDTVSRSKPAEVVRRAIESQVSFYVIHIPLFEPRDDRLAVRPPAKGFRELAEKTGGGYFLAGDSKTALTPNKDHDLTAVFNAIEADLRSQYLIGFYIAEGARKGGTHKVSIALTRQGATYSVAQYGYARSHNFVVNLAPRKSN